MNKTILLCAISFLVLAACNNSSKESEEKKADSTTVKMNSDTMNHMNMNTTTEVPALPAIPDGAKVFFKNLKNGATVKSPFKVEMGTDKIKVDTAGPVVAGSGHHHLMIDDGDSLAAGTMVPKDSTHLHFGKGQMETTLTLAPGKHKLTMQFADGLHRSYGGRLSATINVNVKK
jgi:hypothetical protein